MRFGTSAAVVRVGNMGREAARGPMTGYRAVPAVRPASAVRVGRAPTGYVRTGDAASDAAAAAANANNMGSGGNYLGGCATQYDWSLACKRVLGTGRQNVVSGATVTFSVTPCGPYRIDCIIVPESFALNFEITSIRVCRDDFISSGAPLPAEAFSDQSNYACNLACGAVFFPSLPLLLAVHNISNADKEFSALIIGAEYAFCG